MWGNNFEIQNNSNKHCPSRSRGSEIISISPFSNLCNYDKKLLMIIQMKGILMHVNYLTNNKQNTECIVEGMTST